MTLFALGFRPLYLAAAAFAAFSIAAWSGVFAGLVTPSFLRTHPFWHAHEMLFGYTFAVIVGFLFTAVRNWTGRPTPTGGTLAAIVAAWVVARVLALSPLPWLSLPFDLAFAFAAAAGIGVPLWRARNTRNYFFVALLVAIGLLNAGFHFALLKWIEADLHRIIGVALDLVLFICVVMAGRVIPMFTNNAVPGARARRIPVVEKFALGSVLALLAADLLAAPAWLGVAIALFAAVAHAWRLLLWNPWATRAKPILWILHASYAWVVVHLALRGLSAFGVGTPSLATHAFTVGVIGGLTIGMMTRTARGHTGRELAAFGAETAAYALVMLSAFVRVFVPMSPQWTLPAIALSGLLWAAAFVVFTIRYWPILSRPRVDGLPG